MSVLPVCARAALSSIEPALTMFWGHIAAWVSSPGFGGAAADLLLETDHRQALGIAALGQLVAQAPDVEAARFARVALEPVVFPGDYLDVVDDSVQTEGRMGGPEGRDEGRE